MVVVVVVEYCYQSADGKRRRNGMGIEFEIAEWKAGARKREAFAEAFRKAAWLSRETPGVYFVLESNGEYIAVNRDDVEAWGTGEGPYICKGGRIVYSFDTRRAS